MFDRRMEARVLPYCLEKKIGFMAYGTLGFGLCTGAFTKDTKFVDWDWRSKGGAFGLPLALLELGCSAGLNLVPDLYCYRLGGVAAGRQDSGLSLRPAWEGGDPPFARITVADRAGVDLNPLDVADPKQRQCLLAYVWPDQPERLERIAQAMAIAAEVPLRILEGDAADFVEDEAAILRLGRTLLERKGFTVLAAATPGEALELAAASPEPIDLLITDVVMPEMSGLEVAERLEAICPGARRLFVSGYPEDVIAHRGILEPGVHFLQKPFTQPDLEAKVREALAAPARRG